MFPSARLASRTSRALSRGGRAVMGFTLIELMVVLVIVAVVLMIAAPSYSVLSLRTKLKSYANEVVASAHLARSEAVKRNAPMRLCISADGISCAGAGDWDQGWVVMDPNDTVIKYQQALSGIKVFELSSIPIVSFQPSGITSDAVTLTICQQFPSEGIEEREVRITRTGRPTVKPTKAGCPPP